MGNSAQNQQPCKPNYGSLIVAILFLLISAGLTGIFLFPNEVGISPDNEFTVWLFIVICSGAFSAAYKHYYQSTRPNNTTDDGDDDGGNLI